MVAGRELLWMYARDTLEGFYPSDLNWASWALALASSAVAAAALRPSSSSGERTSAHPGPVRPNSVFIAALCVEDNAAVFPSPTKVNFQQSVKEMFKHKSAATRGWVRLA